MAVRRVQQGIRSEVAIGKRTAKTHSGHLFEKLGFTRRTEAIKIATRRGLVRLEQSNAPAR